MAAKLAIYGGKQTVPDGLIQAWPPGYPSRQRRDCRGYRLRKNYRTATDSIRRSRKGMGGIHGGRVLYPCQ